MKRIIFLISILFIAIPIRAQWMLRTEGLPVSWELPYCLGTYGCNTALISVNTDLWHKPLLYTTNKGLSWTEISWPADTANFEEVWDLFITEPGTFYIGTTIGRIFKTTDTGSTWTLQFSNDTLTNFINYIEFFGSENGVAMGDASSGNIPVFLKTTNGGDDWVSVNNQPIGPHPFDGWRNVDFVNPDTGYYYGFGTNFWGLYKTTDGGTTWDTTNFDFGVWFLKFYNANIGIVTNYGYMYKTTNGGDTWTILNDSLNVLDMEYLNENEIFAVDSRILYSSDGGETWEESPLGVVGYDMELVDSTCGWILAWDGKVFYNDNLNILTSVDKNSQIIPAEFSLFQNYPNPFNPTTTISWQSPVGSWQTLKVYDVLGREVATLVNEYKPAGKYEVEFDAHNLPSGIYIYRIETNGYSASRKMILLK